MTYAAMGTPVLYGSNSNKTSGTSLAVVSNQIVPINTHLFMVIAHDNHASTTAATTTLGNTASSQAWTLRVSPLQQGQTTTAGTGVVLRAYSVRLNAQIASGGALTTITFGSAVVAKVAIAVGISNVSVFTVPGVTIGANGSAAGTPSNPTTGTVTPGTGDVVFACVGGENNATPTGDSDTLNGSWTTMLGLATTGSTADTNIGAGAQFKQVTASGVQTWNPVMANDTVAGNVSFQADAVAVNQFGTPL